MIDHITIRVKDIKITKDFYSKALKPLGYEPTAEFQHEGVDILAFGKDGVSDTWFTTKTPKTGYCHVAYATDSKEVIQEFYDEAIKAGGKDNGAPGPRPEYGGDYYGGFVLDPDGNNIEATLKK